MRDVRNGCVTHDTDTCLTKLDDYPTNLVVSPELEPTNETKTNQHSNEATNVTTTDIVLQVCF